VTEDAHEIGCEATRFYKELYRSEGTENMEAVLNTVPIKVTAEMNNGLVKSISSSGAKIVQR
jgi:hypothetical protein